VLAAALQIGVNGSVLDFDPYAEAAFQDPYPAYEQLRRDAPVYRRSDPDYFMLSRYDDIVAAMSDPTLFSSAGGVLIDIDSSQLPRNLMNMDPPRHDELRGIVTHGLTEASITGLEDVFRSLTVELIERFRGRGECDIVADFARVLPSRVIAEVLGVDASDRENFLRWNHAVNAGSEFTGEDALSAYEELEAYFARVIEERRSNARDDVVGRIFAAQHGGESLSDEEVVGFCTLLLVAGQHGTINLISNAVIELARHPEQFQLLREDPGLLEAGAVEEFMRFIAPVQGLARTTSRDIVLHDVEIPRGSQVLMLFGSGNRDERRWQRPDVLDLTRPADRTHLGFGHGIHYCMGSTVVRLEARVVFEELIARLGGWEVDEASIERNQLIPGRGVGSARIRF
jgi:cytochrome P450